MKKLSILLLSLVGFLALSGCVAYPVPYDNGPHYRGGPGPRYDRDGDGVSDRYDRRPNNPYRY
ncbi:hypothetical protein [Polaromonas sp. JS666]|uniref:hypothetical protein n=1 Tax=Polaromonas sp. (strain JS666 / ATCC BAA-500) TaxID=296591 RepID=UPI00088F3BEE|nr:hypothetical protein [Polaromonas sp. JS666]SDN72787.1 hypothetical protein SAMN05720382_10758 [Polaromonas sp. JS666]